METEYRVYGSFEGEYNLVIVLSRKDLKHLDAILGDMYRSGFVKYMVVERNEEEGDMVVDYDYIGAPKRKDEKQKVRQRKKQKQPKKEKDFNRKRNKDVMQRNFYKYF